MKGFLNLHITNRNTFARLLFGYFLLLLIYRFNSGTFLVFTCGQPMKGPEMDYTFWLSHCTGFPHFVIQHYWACLLIDAGVIIFSLACFISDRSRYLYCILLLLFFFLQRITIESYSCSHSKSMSAVFVALLPFCFKKDRNMNLIVEFSRYFLIFIMFSSAAHKFTNGLLFSPENFVNVLINQHSDLAILNPEHICYKIAGVLISNPKIAALSYILLFSTQAVFTIGFFTRKYDTFLLFFLIVFALTTYFIMRIYNFDIVVLGLFLLYYPRTDKHIKNNLNYRYS